MSEYIVYEKLFEDDEIVVGDILALEPIENKVILAVRHRKQINKQIIRCLCKNRK